jgi:hypothetical protein
MDHVTKPMIAMVSELAFLELKYIVAHVINTIMFPISIFVKNLSSKSSLLTLNRAIIPIGNVVKMAPKSG